MDTMLKDGDFLPAANGRPYSSGGTQEQFQRAAIRLTVPLGAFCYNTKIGSRLNTLIDESTGQDEKALSLAQEAVRGVTQISVAAAQFTAGTPAKVNVTLACGEEQKEIEVSF